MFIRANYENQSLNKMRDLFSTRSTFFCFIFICTFLSGLSISGTSVSEIIRRINLIKIIPIHTSDFVFGQRGRLFLCHFVTRPAPSVSQTFYLFFQNVLYLNNHYILTFFFLRICLTSLTGTAYKYIIAH